MPRESAAFYNAFFLDHDDGGVYFNVLANGLPYLMGTERLKGSHSMSGYHSIGALLPVGGLHQPADHQDSRWTFYFKPLPGGFPAQYSARLTRHSACRAVSGWRRCGWMASHTSELRSAEGLTVKIPDAKSNRCSSKCRMSSVKSAEMNKRCMDSFIRRSASGPRAVGTIHCRQSSKGRASTADGARGSGQESSQLVEPGARFILDMAKVAYMSSAGLRMLLSVYRQVTGKKGGSCWLGCPRISRTPCP